jgi:hypothetical protein
VRGDVASGAVAPGAFFMPAKGGAAMVTWTLVTVGYVAPSVLGAVGLKTTGEAVARWGRAATRSD